MKNHILWPPEHAQKKFPMLSYERTPPKISCFLNGKVRFWSVNVFLRKIFGSKIRTLFFLLIISRFNPLSPNIHIQILQTDLHTLVETIWEKSKIFLFDIILWILVDFTLNNLWISLGENWFWTLLGRKGLKENSLKIDWGPVELSVKTVAWRSG